MKELSLNILDIAQNSIKAEATLVQIILDETATGLILTIKDNGYGMSREFLSTVTDPFSTTRTTRKVGLGLPLLKLAAEQTGGSLKIESRSKAEHPLNHGTELCATFNKDHVDFTPLGDIISTVTLLIMGSADIDFYFSHTLPNGEVELDTRQMRDILGNEVPLSDPAVIQWAKESLEDQYYNIS